MRPKKKKKCLRVLPLLDVRHWCKLSFYAISRKTYDRNYYFWRYFHPLDSNSNHHFFFFFQKSGFQLLSRTILEKINDPILRKLSDWRTHGQTDGRIDFIGRCPTNIERPIKLYTPWNPNMLAKYLLNCIFLFCSIIISKLLPISLNVNYNSWLF